MKHKLPVVPCQRLGVESVYESPILCLVSEDGREDVGVTYGEPTCHLIMSV